MRSGNPTLEPVELFKVSHFWKLSFGDESEFRFFKTIQSTPHLAGQTSLQLVRSEMLSFLAARP